MNLVSYMAKNAFRNPRRTTLTGLSLAVSLGLIVVLQTLLLGITNPIGLDESIPRVVVRHRTSITLLLPRPYEAKLRRVPGVVAATPVAWFGGIWKDDRFENFFPRFATDPETYFKVFVENKTLEPEMFTAFLNTRNGCSVGKKIADRYGFKIGDTIQIRGDIYAFDLDLKVVSIHVGPEADDLLFNIKYLDELLGSTARTGTIFLLAESTQRIDTLLPELVAMFRNSDAEVKAETEKSFKLSFLELLGSVKLFINSLVSVVVLAVLMIAASTMALAIGERTREVATLKAIGFTQSHILALIVGEGMVISLLGGTVGLGLSWLLLPSPKWFLAAAAGLIVAALIALPALLLGLLLPEVGTGRMQSALVAVRGFLLRFANPVAIFAGALVMLILLHVMPSQDWVKFSGGIIKSLDVRGETLLLGACITVLVGFGSSLWPAWKASRMSVLDGLRTLD